MSGDLETAKEILSAWYTGDNAKRLVASSHNDARAMVAKARALCGYNAGAAAMREAVGKAVIAAGLVNKLDYNDLADALAALPIPPDPADALRAENERLKEALRGAVGQMEMDAVQIEGEWGDCRSLQKMEEDNDLPDALVEARAALGAP